VRREGDSVLLARTGPLPGAADWTHAEADSACTGSSADELRAPSAVLWFDASRRWHKYPGQVQVRVVGGRIVLYENGLLQASDVYTGRLLWETDFLAELDGSAGTADRHAVRDARHREWGPRASLAPTTNLVAVEDAIYLSDGSTCRVFDPTTGRLVRRIDVPEGLAALWANVRIDGEYLVGTCGPHVVCVNRHSGALIWHAKAARSQLYLAVGGNKVFCAELADPQRGEDEVRDGSLFALNLHTGEQLWQRAGGARLRYSPTLDVVVTATAVLRAADGEPLPRPTDPAQTRLVILGGGLPKTGLPGLIAGDRLLTGADELLVVHDLPSLTPIGQPTTWVRRGCTGTRASAHLLTTRYRGNSAWIDLESREITAFLGTRPACSINNNLYPANGVLNMPSLTAGCTCNYAPVSVACVPASVVARGGAETSDADRGAGGGAAAAGR